MCKSTRSLSPDRVLHSAISRPIVLFTLIGYFLRQNRWLQGWPQRLEADVMVECLLTLLDDMKHPELFLFLDMTEQGPQWNRFRASPANSRTKVTTNAKHTHAEEVVVDIYLAHLSQWCRAHAQGSGTSAGMDDPPLVLCPQALLACISGPASPGLESILRTVRRVPLRPGRWQDRPGVLRWQAGFAVWRKRGCRGATTISPGTLSCHTISDAPPPYYDLAQETGLEKVLSSEKLPG